MQRTANVEERTLVVRAQAGDRDAFGALAGLYAAPLYTFLVRRCGSRDGAEDLSQMALLRAWLKLPTYRAGRGAFLPWLLAVANSVAVSEKRRRRVRAGPLARDPAHVPPNPMEHAEDRDELWQLVDRLLPADAAAAVWLRYGENLDIGDIARVLSWTGVRVRITLYRARHTLARALGGEQSGVPGKGDGVHAL